MTEEYALGEYPGAEREPRSREERHHAGSTAAVVTTPVGSNGETPFPSKQQGNFP